MLKKSFRVFAIPLF